MSTVHVSAAPVETKLLAAAVEHGHGKNSHGERLTRYDAPGLRRPDEERRSAFVLQHKRADTIAIDDDSRALVDADPHEMLWRAAADPAPRSRADSGSTTIHSAAILRFFR